MKLRLKRPIASFCAGVICLMSMLSGCNGGQPQSDIQSSSTDSSESTAASVSSSENSVSKEENMESSSAKGNEGASQAEEPVQPILPATPALKSHIIENIAKDVYLTAENAEIVNQDILGNLYIQNSSVDYEAQLTDLHVSETIYIFGAQKVTLENVTASNLVIEHKGHTVEVIAKGKSCVEKVTIKTPAILKESGLASGFAGFDKVSTERSAGYIYITLGLEGTKISELTLNALTKLERDGKSSVSSTVNRNNIYAGHATDGSSGAGGSGGGSVTPPPSGSIIIADIADISSLAVGSLTQIALTVLPEQAEVTAISNNLGVATVTVNDLNLTIMGVSAGTATITVKAGKAGYVTAVRTFAVHVIELPAEVGLKREVFNFNTGWKFSKGIGKNNSGSNLPSEAVVVLPDFEKPYEVDYVMGATWSDVSLPHTYNDIDTFNNFMEGAHNGERSMYTGTAWYKKSFIVPTSYLGKKIFLEFEAARQAAKVYLNGTLLEGVSENGFIPFGYDLTSEIKFGQENQITVMVDNSFPYYAEGTQSDILSWNDSHWHPTHGGLYRNANLYITDKLHVTLPLYSFLKTQGVYVYTSNESESSADVHVEAEIQNEYDQAKTFRYVAEVRDMSGKMTLSRTSEEITLEPGAKTIAKLSGKLEDVSFWSDRYPYLYQVVSKVLMDSEEVDSTTTPLGIRTFRFTNDYGMFLNENYVKLQGWGQKPTNEWAGLGAAYPNWMQDFVIKLMKDAGGNFIRWGHCAGSPTQIGLADKYGLAVLQPGVDGEGSTVGGVYSDTAYKIRSEAFRDMIIYYRNNPSILLWELGNQSMPDKEAKALSEIVSTYDHHGKDPSTPKVNSGKYDDTTNSSQRLTAVRQGNSVMAKYVDIDVTTQGPASMSGKPLVEGEYNREEARRGVWDRYTEGFENFKTASGSSYNLTMEQFAVNQISNYNNMIGKVSHSGGANWIFSDSTSHGRVYSEVTRASGEVDAVMLEKEAYYALKTVFTDKVDAYIIGHWNYKTGTKKPVYVASDADSVELFVNGVSKGKGTKTNGCLFTFNDITFEPGTIRAVGYNAKNEQVCDTEKSTHREPAAVRLTAIEGPQGLLANGSDILLIDAEVVDANGNRCLNYDGENLGEKIRFTINDSNGCSIWRGGYNSGIEDTTNEKELYIEAGITRVAVRTTLKPGDIMVSAQIDGLASDTVSVTSKAVDNENGLSKTMNETLEYSLSGLSDPGFGDGSKPGESSGSSNLYKSLLFDNLNYNGSATKIPAGIKSPSAEGEQIYTDATNIKFGHLPVQLLNGEYVQVPSEDAGYLALDLVNFQMLRDADLYIAHDDRAARPAWLTETFNETDMDIQINGATHSIFHKTVLADDKFSLGGNGDTAEEGLKGNMYVVIAKLAGKSEVFLEDDFENQTVGETPAGWSVQAVENTSILVDEVEDGEGGKSKVVRLWDNNREVSDNLAVISRKFLPQKGVFSFEYKLYNVDDTTMTQDESFVRFLLHKGPPNPIANEKTGFVVETYLNQVPQNSGTYKLQYRDSPSGDKDLYSTPLETEKWYTVRYVVDMESKEFDAYVDDELVKENAKFVNNLDFADHIILGTAAKRDTNVLIDDVKVEVLENRLQSITAGGTEFTDFDIDASDIQLTLPIDTDTSKAPVLEAIARDAYATVEIIQAESFDGKAMIKITPLSSDGEERIVNVTFTTGETGGGEGGSGEPYIDSDFEDDAAGSVPSGWQIAAPTSETSVKVIQEMDGNKAVEIKDTDAGSAILHSAIPAQQGRLAFEWRIKNIGQGSNDQYFRILLHNGGVPTDPQDKSGMLIESYLHGGKLVYRDKNQTGSNKDIFTLNKNQWYTIRYEVDIDRQLFDVYVDDTPVKTGLQFRHPAAAEGSQKLTSADHIIFASGGVNGAGTTNFTANVLLDDIKVELLDNELKEILVDGVPIEDFNMDTTEYIVTLPDGFDPLNPSVVTATARDNESEIEITQAGDQPTAVIKTTAYSGGTKTVTIHFVGETDESELLQEVLINDMRLPAFSSSVREYNIVLPPDTDVAELEVTTGDGAEGEPEVTDADELPGTATVAVQPAGGGEPVTYQFHFTVAEYELNQNFEEGLDEDVWSVSDSGVSVEEGELVLNDDGSGMFSAHAKLDNSYNTESLAGKKIVLEWRMNPSDTQQWIRGLFSKSSSMDKADMAVEVYASVTKGTGDVMYKDAQDINTPLEPPLSAGTVKNGEWNTMRLEVVPDKSQFRVTVGGSSGYGTKTGAVRINSDGQTRLSYAQFSTGGGATGIVKIDDVKAYVCSNLTVL